MNGRETARDDRRTSTCFVCDPSDMRTPLRAMNAFATLILDEVSGLTEASPQVLDACRRIGCQRARLDRLIQDSLNYTRSVLQEVPLPTSGPRQACPQSHRDLPESPFRQGPHPNWEHPLACWATKNS